MASKMHSLYHFNGALFSALSAAVKIKQPLEFCGIFLNLCLFANEILLRGESHKESSDHAIRTKLTE